MASGAAGYQNLEKVGNYISDNSNKAADRSAANYRQSAAIIDGAQARKDKRLDEALGMAVVDTDSLQAKVTGFTGRDDVARDYAKAATDRSMEYAQMAREAASKGDWTTHRTYLDKMQRIKGDFKNAVNDEASLKALFDTQRAKYDAGEIDDDDWLEFGAAIEDSNYQISLDENDNRVITALVRGEDGKMHSVTKKMSEIINGDERPYEVVKVGGKDGLVNEMLVNFGKRTIDVNTGDYMNTDQVWDEKNEKAFNMEMNSLYSSDRKMYSLLKQATGERKKSGFNEEDKKAVRDMLYDQVRGAYDETSTVKVNSRTRTDMKEDAAANRAVTMRGQDIGAEEFKKTHELNLQKQILAEWEAKNPKSAGKATKEDISKASVAKFYQVAKNIAKLDKRADESEVQAVLDESGLGFVIGSNFDFWGLQGTQYDFGNEKGVKIKDVMTNIKAMAKEAGIELSDTDLADVIKNDGKIPETKADGGDTVKDADYYLNKYGTEEKSE